MIAIPTGATVTADGTLIIEIPNAKLPAGEHQAVVVVEGEPVSKPKQSITFSSHDIGPWPEGLTFRREEMYGDDGR